MRGLLAGKEALKAFYARYSAFVNAFLRFITAFAAVFLVLLKGMWPGLRAARPWMVSLVVAALVSRLVPGAWYVAAGAVSGLAAALVLGEDA